MQTLKSLLIYKELKWKNFQKKITKHKNQFHNCPFYPYENTIVRKGIKHKIKSSSAFFKTINICSEQKLVQEKINYNGNIQKKIRNKSFQSPTRQHRSLWYLKLKLKSHKNCILWSDYWFLNNPIFSSDDIS